MPLPWKLNSTVVNLWDLIRVLMIVVLLLLHHSMLGTTHVRTPVASPSLLSHVLQVLLAVVLVFLWLGDASIATNLAIACPRVLILVVAKIY